MILSKSYITLLNEKLELTKENKLLKSELLAVYKILTDLQDVPKEVRSYLRERMEGLK